MVKAQPQLKPWVLQVVLIEWTEPVNNDGKRNLDKKYNLETVELL